MRYREILWWFCYLVFAILLQKLLPGFDAMVPGLLLTLQSKKKWHTFWLIIIASLIQEGTGSLAFGASVLWYGGIAFLFRLSANLFVTNNILFVLMLSTSIGLLHFLLLSLMTSIQDIHINYNLVIYESFEFALFTPLLWGMFYLLRPKEISYAR